jgi:hypothetical protein
LLLQVIHKSSFSFNFKMNLCTFDRLLHRGRMHKIWCIFDRYNGNRSNLCNVAFLLRMSVPIAVIDSTERHLGMITLDKDIGIASLLSAGWPDEFVKNAQNVVQPIFCKN